MTRRGAPAPLALTIEMTRTPMSDHPPALAPGGTSPGEPHRGRRLFGLTVRLTAGGYVLAITALLVSGITLPAAAPGRPAAAYLAAAAGLTALLVGSLVLHESGHDISARRPGVRVGAITVGLFGATAHGSHPAADSQTAHGSHLAPGSQTAHGSHRAPGSTSMGGQAVPQAAPTGPRAQWRVAAAGPAASLALALVTGAIAAGVAALGTDRLAVLVLTVAAFGNAVLGILSLLPGAGPDGGRIVRALTAARTGDPAKAGVVAARTGQVTGAVLAAAGLAVVLLGYAAGLWLALIGILAFVSSRSEARQLLTNAALTGLRVGDVVPLRLSAEAGVPSWQTAESFLAGRGAGTTPGSNARPASNATPGSNARPASAATPGSGTDGPGGAGSGGGDLSGAPAAPGLAGFGATAFPLVDFGGQAAGLLTLSQLAAVPAERHAEARLRDVAPPLAHVVTTLAHVVTTLADEPVASLLGRLSVWPLVPAAVHTAGYALVLGPDGPPAGVLTPADLSRATQIGQVRHRTLTSTSTLTSAFAGVR
jgi:Zn-dependent protease